MCKVNAVLRDITISPTETILNAIKILDKTALQILIVVDQSKRLLGTVTDGDIRRGILKGLEMNSPVSAVMNANPITIDQNTGYESAVSLMRSCSIHCVPVVDVNGCVVGLETESRLLWQGIDEDTCVVLMVGGKGMRLRPLTENLPKPLLEVNGKPMLEHIISRFAASGFRRFFISVNYKSEMIVNHFGDGAAHNVEIGYIEENKPLGTGGALSLLPERLSKEIIVMNGDLLTTLNFRQLLNFHRSHGGVATMAVRDYSIRFPYGVVQVDSEEFVDVIEKPAHSYFVNAGIYVINSDQLNAIPKDEFFDLPDLFGLLKRNGEKVTVFPIREEWRDVGSHQDYQQAQAESADS